MSEFLSMGGYAFYVWGSYGVALGALALEVVFLLRRARKIKYASSK
jgi:heme exporter protein D